MLTSTVSMPFTAGLSDLDDVTELWSLSGSGELIVGTTDWSVGVTVPEMISFSNFTISVILFC